MRALNLGLVLRLARLGIALGARKRLLEALHPAPPVPRWWLALLSPLRPGGARSIASPLALTYATRATSAVGAFRADVPSAAALRRPYSTCRLHLPSPPPSTDATMALPLYVPLAYIVLLVAALSAFSRIHRRRAAGRLAADATTQPWFPGGHPERDVYQTLVAADAAAQEDGKARVPENVLRAALMSRAMADVRRLRRLREDKVALAVLLQRGSLGDVTAERFALAEKELEAELLDTASEANSFHPGWGQVLFQQANEMVNHVKVKETYYAISANREAHSTFSLLLPYSSLFLITTFDRAKAQGSGQAGAAAQGGHSAAFHAARHADPGSRWCPPSPAWCGWPTSAHQVASPNRCGHASNWRQNYPPDAAGDCSGQWWPAPATPDGHGYAGACCTDASSTSPTS